MQLLLHYTIAIIMVAILGLPLPAHAILNSPIQVPAAENAPVVGDNGRSQANRNGDNGRSQANRNPNAAIPQQTPASAMRRPAPSTPASTPKEAGSPSAAAQPAPQATPAAPRPTAAADRSSPASTGSSSGSRQPVRFLQPGIGNRLLYGLRTLNPELTRNLYLSTALLGVTGLGLVLSGLIHRPQLSGSRAFKRISLQ